MFKPIRDNIIVRDRKAPKATKSGLALPESHMGDVVIADVLDCGEGKRLENGGLLESPVEQGDVVLIHKNAGINYKYDDEDYRAIASDHIISVSRGKRKGKVDGSTDV